MSTETAQAATTPIASTDLKTHRPTFSRKALVAGLIAIALGAGGAFYIAVPKSSVSTDNAYVQADSSIVAPKVRGLVAEVLVRHNQKVKRGDALVRIDPEEFGLAQAEAAVAGAQAALNLAQQDQQHTMIFAPFDGVVADRQVEQGDYVQPGTRLLSIVPINDLYVVANFKETQTGRMTAGQSASIEIDALPGVVLKAQVESFAPGSGSQFSLLPFEPGTGNFTKIVQRVPVRIRVDSGQHRSPRCVRDYRAR